MDPVTHGLIGASAAQSAADPMKLRLAAIAGAAAAMLPDLDVLIGTPDDPLLTLEYHRQFTHSVFLAPAGALLVTAALWWIVKKQLNLKETYLFSLLGMTTAGIADIFTSYGVQYFWPVSNTRFSWNLVSVFDPLFTLGILIPFGLALYTRKRTWGWMALGWVGIYLLFALTQQQKAEIAAREMAANRNHFMETLIVKPTLGNQLVWSTRYVSGNRIYADGVRLLPFAEPLVYRGESAPLVRWRNRFEQYRGTVLYRDIRRFSELSGGILVDHPETQQVIGDGRYAMLPTSVSPLWGIRADTTRPNEHVAFNTYRDAGPEVRSQFINMLLGRPIN
ncbi:MAG: metal-dependent hydrolase [Balneolaceae bacterium]|nr:metal-dependent hydrolase [Balneolaceae bacterium]